MTSCLVNSLTTYCHAGQRFLDAVTHAHAVHYVIAAMTMRDRSTIRPDTAYAVDTTSTDHGICVSALDSLGRRESGDGEIGKYQHPHSCLPGTVSGQAERQSNDEEHSSNKQPRRVSPLRG